MPQSLISTMSTIKLCGITALFGIFWWQTNIIISLGALLHWQGGGERANPVAEVYPFELGHALIKLLKGPCHSLSHKEGYYWAWEGGRVEGRRKINPLFLQLTFYVVFINPCMRLSLKVQWSLSWWIDFLKWVESGCICITDLPPNTHWTQWYSHDWTSLKY